MCKKRLRNLYKYQATSLKKEKILGQWQLSNITFGHFRMLLLLFKHKDNEVLLVQVYITRLNQYYIPYIPSPLHKLEVKPMCIFVYASVKKAKIHIHKN